MKWENILLGDIIKISKGKKEVESIKTNKSVRYIQIDDLRNDNNLKYCIPNNKSNIVVQNDIIIVWDGANAGTVGYGFNGVIGSTLAKLKIIGKDVYSPYIGKYLQSRFSIISKFCNGAAIPHVSGSFLKSIRIPFPPLPIQKKIAEVLDKADSLRKKRKEAIAKLDELAQSIFLDMFGDPVTNPKGWEVKRLEDIAKHLTDGPFGSNLKTSHYCGKGIRVIRLQNIGINHFSDEDKVYIDEDHYKKFPRNHCLPGDVLIATMGEPNIRSCLLPLNIKYALNKADCILFKGNESITNNLFISYQLNQDATLYKITNMLHGQTRIRVSLGQLKQLKMIIPPLKFQQQFESQIKKLHETQCFSYLVRIP